MCITTISSTVKQGVREQWDIAANKEKRMWVNVSDFQLEIETSVAEATITLIQPLVTTSSHNVNRRVIIMNLW